MQEDLQKIFVVYLKRCVCTFIQQDKCEAKICLLVSNTINKLGGKNFCLQVKSLGGEHCFCLNTVLKELRDLCKAAIPMQRRREPSPRPGVDVTFHANLLLFIKDKKKERDLHLNKTQFPYATHFTIYHLIVIRVFLNGGN